MTKNILLQTVCLNHITVSLCFVFLQQVEPYASYTSMNLGMETRTKSNVSAAIEMQHKFIHLVNAVM